MENKTHKELRELVMEKFGSMRVFAESAGLDFNQVNGFLYRDDDNISEEEQKRIAAMWSIAEGTKKMTDKKQLVEEEWLAIKLGIQRVHGNVKELARTNDNWSQSALQSLVNGRTKKKSQRVVDLINELISSMETAALNEFESKALSILQKSIS